MTMDLKHIIAFLYGIPMGVLVFRALVKVGEEWIDMVAAWEKDKAAPPSVLSFGILLLRLCGAVAWPLAIFPYVGAKLRARRERLRIAPPDGPAPTNGPHR